jgi:hypothetical protein
MTCILFYQEGANAGKQAQVKALCLNEQCLPASGPSWMNPPGGGGGWGGGGGGGRG